MELELDIKFQYLSGKKRNLSPVWPLLDEAGPRVVLVLAVSSHLNRGYRTEATLLLLRPAILHIPQSLPFREKFKTRLWFFLLHNKLWISLIEKEISAQLFFEILRLSIEISCQIYRNGPLNLNLWPNTPIICQFCYLQRPVWNRF